MRGWRQDVELPECGSNLPEIIVHYAPEFTNALENITAKHFEEDLLNLTCEVVGKLKVKLSHDNLPTKSLPKLLE